MSHPAVEGAAPARPLGLFEATGVEIEYMIVDAQTLSVRPLADQLLREVGGSYEMEVGFGDVAWSNELALHVIEIKTDGPRTSLAGLGVAMQAHIGRIEAVLAPMGARLMPTGMHPWMDPHRELVLWPHEDDIIYRTFDRIFDCRGHGWANLQSTHINLPFAGDDEFGRLHAAIRLVLPILPALAASSPLADGCPSGLCDTRLRHYRDNARRVPSVTGAVVPEPVFTRADYERRVLQRIYADMAELDPEGVLGHEWVNARGAIARFDRDAIEIRVLDNQECPRADVAVIGAVVAVVRDLVEAGAEPRSDQRGWDERRLAAIFDAAVRGGDQAVIDDADYLRLFGYPEPGPARAGALWQHLVDTVVARDPVYPEWAEALRCILTEGCLARRITRALGQAPGPDAIRDVYGRLSECLRRGALFHPDEPGAGPDEAQ
ncbi:carboxylate-amine ligase [Haliangium sp.]|uniref:carboxylate-amine ligase n=1 Tax=Haliangium sp. TaxID=2663208 RepID=UPI003D0E1054